MIRSLKDLHIYVVSLHSEPVRKARLTDLLETAGLLPQTTFLPAVHKSYINKNYLDSQGFAVFDEWLGTDHSAYQNPIKTGEIACAIGHYMGWKAFSKSKYKYALILEDDAVWEEDIVKELKEFIQFNKKDKSNIFYLGRIVLKPNHTRYDGFDELKELKGEEWVTDRYTRPVFSYNLQSYVLDRKAVTTILDSEPEKALMTPDDIVPAFYTDHRHEKIRKRFPKKLKALALTVASEPNNTERPNVSVGITWQEAGAGVSFSILNNSEAYKE